MRFSCDARVIRISNEGYYRDKQYIPVENGLDSIEVCDCPNLEYLVIDVKRRPAVSISNCEQLGDVLSYNVEIFQIVNCPNIRILDVRCECSVDLSSLKKLDRLSVKSPSVQLPQIVKWTLLSIDADSINLDTLSAFRIKTTASVYEKLNLERKCEYTVVSISSQRVSDFRQKCGRVTLMGNGIVLCSDSLCIGDYKLVKKYVSTKPTCILVNERIVPILPRMLMACFLE